MKTIIFILLFPVISFSQMTGVNEIDSLLFLKDQLLLLDKYERGLYNRNSSLEYDWVHYKWLRWLGCEKEQKCIYDYKGKRVVGECTIDTLGIPSMQLIKDTIILIPPNITFEDFMDYRINKIINQ